MTVQLPRHVKVRGCKKHAYVIPTICLCASFACALSFTTLLPFLECKEPNVLRLCREQPEALQQYRAARRQVQVYKAAARLWGNDMNWPQALEIATEAFSVTV